MFTNSMVFKEEYNSLSEELFFLYNTIPFFFQLLHFLEYFDAFKGTYSYDVLFEAHESATDS